MRRPLPPPVRPISVISASPGPFTTQPMIDSVIGVSICASRSSSVRTVLITLKPCRAQDGQEMTFTPRWRMPERLEHVPADPHLLLRLVRQATRIVSPMPAQSRGPTRSPTSPSPSAVRPPR